MSEKCHKRKSVAVKTALNPNVMDALNKRTVPPWCAIVFNSENMVRSP
jgi:hypothetical protein